MELTPKEKAKQLVRDFANKNKGNNYYNTKYCNGIRASLLCVEMIQAELIKLNSDKSLELFNYYQDVNKELNKL